MARLSLSNSAVKRRTLDPRHDHHRPLYLAFPAACTALAVRADGATAAGAARGALPSVGADGGAAATDTMTMS